MVVVDGGDVEVEVVLDGGEVFDDGVEVEVVLDGGVEVGGLVIHRFVSRSITVPRLQ